MLFSDYWFDLLLRHLYSVVYERYRLSFKSCIYISKIRYFYADLEISKGSECIIIMGSSLRRKYFLSIDTKLSGNSGRYTNIIFVISPYSCCFVCDQYKLTFIKLSVFYSSSMFLYLSQSLSLYISKSLSITDCWHSCICFASLNEFFHMVSLKCHTFHSRTFSITTIPLCLLHYLLFLFVCLFRKHLLSHVCLNFIVRSTPCTFVIY